MSTDQLKEGLILHLETNRNYVQEKVYKEFAKECLEEHDISTLNRKKMKSVIQFIFDFGANDDFKPFFNKLQTNIQNFIKQEKGKKPPNNKGKVPMDLQNLVELIFYCVNNSFQKQSPKAKQVPKKIKVQDKSRQKRQVPKEEEIKKQEKKKPQITLLNPQLQAKVDKIKLVSKPIEAIKAPAKVSTRMQPQKLSQKSQFVIPKHQMPKLNVGPKYLQSLTPKSKPVQHPQPIPIYEPLPQQILKDQAKQRQMQQRLLDLFKHYCSQQQNTGHSPSFDRIKSEMEHMTVGKFLLFCKNTRLFDQTQQGHKDTQLNAFRKIAQGKKQINFSEFQNLLKLLDSKYIEEILKKGKDNPATYEARLRLNSNQGYKQFKKWVNMIFYTRDNQNKLNKLCESNFNKKDLTAHSGKIGKDLEQELNTIRYSQTIQTLSNNTRRKNSLEASSLGSKKHKKPKALNIQEINMKQWPKIDWLEEEVKQQQGNEGFLPKIARRKDLAGNSSNRAKQGSKMELEH